MKTQVCNLCGQEKPLTEFEWQKNRPNPRKTCNECKNKQAWERIKNNPEKHEKFLNKRKIWRDSNSEIIKHKQRKWYHYNNEKVKNSYIKSVYGLTLEEYYNKIEEQNNRCAICGREFKNSKDTYIDHNHTTGEIRGLLCSKCNPAIGLLSENQRILYNAIVYLSNYEHFELL